MSEGIEQLGITKLKDSLLRSKFLITEIRESNTIPSWDGFIRLYKNEDKNKKKSDLVARIPVQVKGEMNSYIYSEEIKYPIKKSDLRNYLQDGGVIFFVVRIMDHDNYRIYYETLIPLKIKRYMKSMGKRKSISICIKTFPKEKADEITDIFFTFANDMNKQASDNFLSINEYKTIQPIGFDSFAMYYQGVKYKNRNPMDYFLENEVTVYVKHSGTDIIIPVDLVILKEYVRDFNLPVLIEKTEYYSNFKSLYSKEGIKMIIGNSVSFFYPKDNENVNFNIKFQGTLSQRIKDSEFVIALLENKHFTVGVDTPHDFKLGSSDKKLDFNEKINYYKSYLDYLLDIKKVLSILRVTVELDFENWTDKDEENINVLISSILHNNPQELIFSKENMAEAFRKNIAICNISVAILFKKRNDGKYTLSNFFDGVYTVTYQIPSNLQTFNGSIYLFLTEDDFLKVSNLDYDIIYNSFLNLEANDELFNMTNQFVLKMVKTYDISKKQILLETSLKILDWIIKNDHITHKEIYKINKMQIIKRMRKLSDSEISQLHFIASNNKEDKILTGAHLLLENIDMATFYFSRLPIQEQDEFKKYPINIFWESK